MAGEESYLSTWKKAINLIKFYGNEQVFYLTFGPKISTTLLNHVSDYCLIQLGPGRMNLCIPFYKGFNDQGTRATDRSVHNGVKEHCSDT